MRTVLLTGATGTLGRHLFDHALALGPYRVVLLVRPSSDLTHFAAGLDGGEVTTLDVADVSGEALAERGVDTVLHCAACYGRNGESEAEIWATNHTLPTRLFDASVAAGVGTFVNSATPLPPDVGHYAASKGAFVRELRRRSGRVAVIDLVLEHFYAPAGDRGFLSGVAAQLARAVPRIELTAGAQRRNFVHILDVVRAFQVALDAGLPAGYHELHVGTDETWPLRDVLLRLKALMGNTATELGFGDLPYRPREPMDSNVDSRALVALGWIPRITLEQGLRELAGAQPERGVDCGT